MLLKYASGAIAAEQLAGHVQKVLLSPMVVELQLRQIDARIHTRYVGVAGTQGSSVEQLWQVGQN